MNLSATISIIIPVLNEEANVEVAVANAKNIADEVIVVDGGSDDQTLAILKQLDCLTVNSPRGRGQQISAGCEHASGSILLFLHADTRLDSAARQQILEAWNRTQDEASFCGYFKQKINDARIIYRLIEVGNHWRAHYQKLPYGDQGVFVSRDLYDHVGGMPEITLMEDFEFARRIAKHGKLYTLEGPIHVDARRWQTMGPVRQTIRNWRLAMRYRLGARPDQLLRKY